jgi:hypothetical protein
MDDKALSSWSLWAGVSFRGPLWTCGRRLIVAVQGLPPPGGDHSHCVWQYQTDDEDPDLLADYCNLLNAGASLALTPGAVPVYRYLVTIETMDPS